MEPEWSDLKIILALSRAGSVAGAARGLGVDQSTVSRRLAALEDSMGAKLIVRGGREFALTPEGRAMCSAAERVETAVAEASRTVRNAKLEVSGTVRVSCPPAFLPHLMSALAAAREKYPALVGALSGDYRTVDLAKGEADMAIRAFRPTESDLVVRKLADTEWGVFSSRAYAASRGLPKSIDELPRHALVLYAAPMHTVGGLRWMEEHKGDATELARVDNIEMGAVMLASGSGIGILPGFIAAKQPELVRVFPESVFTNHIYCVFHESARDTARVRAAADAFASYFETNASLFAAPSQPTSV